MAKERQKFIERQDKRKRQIIKNLIKDILDGKMNHYDCKSMKGMDNHWRVKCDNIRIIVSKDIENDYVIKKIDFRGSVYKN